MGRGMQIKTARRYHLTKKTRDNSGGEDVECPDAKGKTWVWGTCQRSPRLQDGLGLLGASKMYFKLF